MTITPQHRLGHQQLAVLDLLHAASYLAAVDGLTGPEIARAVAQSYAETATRLIRLAELGLVHVERVDPPPPGQAYLTWHPTERHDR